MTLENSLQKDEEPLWNSLDFTGRTIAGHKIIRKLGEGGFGVVYLAEKNKRKFALKFIKDNESRLVKELKKEYKLVLGIRHPNVLKVHGFDSASSFCGRFELSPFIAMDYVEGLKALDVTEISTDQIFDVMNQTIEGLLAAHDSGLIHKDLKPNNILITPDGQVKISDFGLGKIITEHPEFSISLSLKSQEATGLEGTLGYFPPDPEEHKNPDKRFDLYSLGVVFYQLLLGEKKFPLSDAADDIKNACKKRKLSQYETNSLVKLVTGLLKRKENRYESISELKASTEYRVLTGKNAKARDFEEFKPEPGYEPTKKTEARQDKPLPRRQFLEGTWAKALEFCSLIPIAGFAIKNLISRREYPIVKVSPVDKIKEYQQSINSLGGCFAPVNNDLAQIWQFYKDNFYKSRTETRTVPHVDGDGNVTLRTETHTVYYWDVPKGLPDEDTVKKWRDNTEDITSKIASISKQPFFDYSGNNFEIKKEKANLAAEIAILACAYGSIGAALMFYEEALEMLNHDFSAKKNMSRRNLFKLGAVAAGSVPVCLLDHHYTKTSNKRAEEAEEQIKKILYNTRNLPDNAIISEVLGDTPANLVNTMRKYAATAQSAMGYREGNTFASLFSSAQSSQANLQRIFNPITEQLSLPMRNAYGLKKIGEYNTHGSTGILLEHLLEAGVFGGIVATILGIVEPIFQTTK